MGVVDVGGRLGSVGKNVGEVSGVERVERIG